MKQPRQWLFDGVGTCCTLPRLMPEPHCRSAVTVLLQTTEDKEPAVPLSSASLKKPSVVAGWHIES